MTQNARPKRQKKADRILHGDLTKPEIACDYGVAPFDRMAIEMDRKWGVDRLPELVSPEIASKYGNTLAELNQALRSNDPDASIKWAEACMRGMAFMDAEAERLGHKPMPSEMIEVEADGFHIGILKDAAQWQDIADARPGLKLVSPRQVAMAVKFYEENFIDTVKGSFPDAKVIQMKPPLQVDHQLNDEIPGF